MNTVYIGDKKLLCNDLSIIYYRITSNCNFHCNYCSDVKNDGTDINPFYVIDKISEIDKSKLYITYGGGEPLIHKQFEDILKYSYEKFSKFDEVKWKIMTNGEHDIDYIKNLNLKNFLIAITYHPHSKRPKEHFEKIIDYLLKDNIVDIRIPIYGDISKQLEVYKYFKKYLHNDNTIAVWPKYITDENTIYDKNILDFMITENIPKSHYKDWYHMSVIDKDGNKEWTNRERSILKKQNIVDNTWFCYLKGINTYINNNGKCYSCTIFKHDEHTLDEMVKNHNNFKPWIICPSLGNTRCTCEAHLPKYKRGYRHTILGE